MRREAEEEVAKQFDLVLDEVNDIIEELEKEEPDIEEAICMLNRLKKEL